MANKKNCTYKYIGPIPLGSVIAHNCGAAGLFVPTSSEEKADILIQAEERNGIYLLTISTSEEIILTGEAAITTEGRKILGKESLYALRKWQGLPTHTEWGSLVGVRPMKLYHKLWDKLGQEKLVQEKFLYDYDVSDNIVQMLSDIAHIQKPYLNKRSHNDREISLYSGIPFCQSRCIYCSFPYGLIQDFPNLEDFVKTYLQDIEDMDKLLKKHQLKVSTLYMGGGTPTSLGENDFSLILTNLAKLIQIGQEFTVEAGRPDSVTLEKIKIMQKVGVNRISINPQCMHDDVLKAIGRAHSADDVKILYDMVRRNTNFSVNMDFIAGLPQQSFSYMKENMEFVCRTRPENVTIHTLALKRGSPLYAQKDTIHLPSVEEVKEMVDYSRDKLEAAGYRPYYLYRQQYMTGQLENIGYALPDYECEYNIQMMEERQTVLSIGPGSASKWMRSPEYRQIKQHMPKDLPTYLTTLPTLLAKRNSICEKFWECEK